MTETKDKFSFSERRSDQGFPPVVISPMERSTTNFAWALMAGLDFNVTQNLKLELGYRYLNMGKIHCPAGPTA